MDQNTLVMLLRVRVEKTVSNYLLSRKGSQHRMLTLKDLIELLDMNV